MARHGKVGSLNGSSSVTEGSEVKEKSEIFIDPPQSTCGHSLCQPRYPSGEDDEEESECYDYGCILLFSFIAVIQIALAILSFSGVREGDSTDSQRDLNITEESMDFSQELNCTLFHLLGNAETPYAEPSYILAIFSIVAMIILLCGPFGMMMWNLLIGPGFVAHYHIRLGDLQALCPDENLAVLAAVMDAQAVCSALFWIVLIVVCVIKLVRRYVQAREADDVSVTAIHIAL